MNAYEAAIVWLTGIWSLGLGFRVTLELLNHDAFLVTGVLWLDWVPLLVLGALTAAIAVRRLAGELYRGGSDEK